jgi:hypothetical protein
MLSLALLPALPHLRRRVAEEHAHALRSALADELRVEA